MTANPFTVLGLPTDPDVSDEQVRAAWRAIAAATHPDRPDGGNVHALHRRRHRLRPAPHRVGTIEAYADLTTDLPGTVAPAPGPPPAGRTPCGPARDGRAASRPASGTDGPATLLLRAVLTALLSLAVVNLLPGQPSGPAVVTGLITWFVLTARGDLAPPPGR